MAVQKRVWEEVRYSNGATFLRTPMLQSESGEYESVPYIGCFQSMSVSEAHKPRGKREAFWELQVFSDDGTAK